MFTRRPSPDDKASSAHGSQPRRTVAIIGGAGFIGHSLALHLKHDVACIDSLGINNFFVLKDGRYRDFLTQRMWLLSDAGIPLIIADARDYNSLSSILGGIKPDIMFHLAAVAHIDRAKKSPFTTFDHSLRTLENSLDAARALGCPLVYFSSSTAYGDFSQPIIDEDEALTPHGIYGNLKLAGERMCIAYHQDYGHPITIIRPQALYGPRCVSGRVTQIFIEQALRGEPLTIHGDGTARHDFTYIDDLCDAMQMIVDQIPEGLNIWNVTAGKATKMSQLANIVAERYDVPIRYGSKDDDKPSRGTMSCEKIGRELGWQPRIDIRAGMTRYMDWYDGQEKDQEGDAGVQEPKPEVGLG